MNANDLNINLNIKELEEKIVELKKNIEFYKEKLDIKEKDFLINNLLKFQSEVYLSGILVVDENGNSTFFNDIFGQLWNIPKEILNTKNDTKMLQYVSSQLMDPKEFYQKVQYIYQHKKEKTIDEIKFKNGKFLERHSFPLMDFKGQYHGRIWYFRDITKEKKLKEETQKENTELLNKSLDELQIKNADLATMEFILKDLRDKHEVINEQLKQEAARANAMSMAADQASIAKNTFLANVGHELRTPLNDIIGFAEILLDSKNTTSENQQTYIKTLHKRTKDLLILVNDLLDISKIEAGKVALSCEIVKFKQLINEICKPFENEIKNKNIEFQINIEKNIPQYLFLDPFRLKQIMSNLISNANKFTDIGKIAIAIKKIFNKTHENNHKIELEISVSDTGIGIPKNYHPKLFQPFYQVETSNHAQYGGTGLGLAISKRLVELMGGNIRVEDNIPIGCIFYFTIIVDKIEEQKIYQMIDDGKIKAKSEEILSKRNINILVVENELTSLHILRININAKSPNIIFNSATNGQEAIIAYQQKPIDIIITDIVMPIMDGFDLIQQIRSIEKDKNKHTPIIAMTASAGEKDKEKCLNAGADFYIAKPITKSDLYKILDKAIEKYFS